MKVAVVIGHEPKSKGAFSPYLAMSEYDYNSEVVKHLPDDIAIYRRKPGVGYQKQMRLLADEMNPEKFDLVIELHFNAANNLAHGCEALIYKKNASSRLFGGLFCRNITKAYGTRDRGVKELEVPSDRGFYFVYYQSANALILEPFFGDNPEAKKFLDPKKYACIIETTINDYMAAL